MAIITGNGDDQLLVGRAVADTIHGDVAGDLLAQDDAAPTLSDDLLLGLPGDDLLAAMSAAGSSTSATCC